MTSNKVTIIAQARMSSSRLPGKVLRKISDKTILGHLTERLKKAKMVDKIIIATSTDKEDDKIAEHCLKLGVDCYRGSLENVLSRFYNAALKYNAENIIRICCDSPLISGDMIDEVSEFYLKNDYDIILTRGVPVGFAFEVFGFDKLEDAFLNASKDYQQEHVTPYIYENTDKCFLYKYKPDYSDYRFTLDTEDDFKMLEAVFDNLYENNHYFKMQDVINLMKEKPELINLNKDVVQKSASIDYVKNKE